MNTILIEPCRDLNHGANGLWPTTQLRSHLNAVSIRRTDDIL